MKKSKRTTTKQTTASRKTSSKQPEAVAAAVMISLLGEIRDSINKLCEIAVVGFEGQQQSSRMSSMESRSARDRSSTSKAKPQGEMAETSKQDVE